MSPTARASRRPSTRPCGIAWRLRAAPKASATGLPVGSRTISKMGLSLSAASIRNVMQDLEELGLVYAPHTSAGRLPTELGLRFYVDSMLQVSDLADIERARINAEGIAGWDQRIQLFSQQGIEALVPATLERWFAPDIRTGDSALMQRMSEIIRATSLPGYVSCVNAIKGMAMHDHLHRINLPTLYLAGAQDGGAPVSEMQAMAAEVKGSRCVVLDPCGHISPMQRPQDFVRTLNDFIALSA